MNIEVRIFQDSGDTWTVVGLRGGEHRYTRAYNRSVDEALQYASAWVRDEMRLHTRETK